MAQIQRLTDSCVLVTSDSDATLIDPGFHTFELDEFDLETIGDVSRVLITHQHPDHVDPEFVKWLIDRRSDLVIHGNSSVAELLEPDGVEVVDASPAGVGHEDVNHGMLPNGTVPPNRSYTVDGLFTHPGDSREPSVAAPVLAVPLMVPWDSTRGAIEFAARLAPTQVIPIHDFYLNKRGRDWVTGMAKNILADRGIEVVPLDYGDSYTV